METPVLILIFNRPQKTIELIKHISTAKPRKLYISADGPRNEQENEITDLTRKSALTAIDWDCEVITMFRESNLGCGPACDYGISWFFENEERGIILEDDCHPTPDFFPFCSELLEKYKDQEQIMHIGGYSLYPFDDNSTSYYFSIYPKVWGWASWRRAWSKMKLDISNDLEFISSGQLYKLFNDDKIQGAFWEITLYKMARMNINHIWDYMWAYNIRKNNGICITPRNNLIKNVGFEEGTHTHQLSSLATKVMKNPPSKLSFPLIHPQNIEVNKKEDWKFFRNQLVDTNFKYFKVLIKRIFPFINPPIKDH